MLPLLSVAVSGVLTRGSLHSRGGVSAGQTLRPFEHRALERHRPTRRHARPLEPPLRASELHAPGAHSVIERVSSRSFACEWCSGHRLVIELLPPSSSGTR